MQLLNKFFFILKVKRIFGQTQVHKISVVCDVHTLFNVDKGDSIQMKIVSSLSDENAGDETTYEDVKSVLAGSSLADSFPYIMNGRIYHIEYADLK